MTAKTCIICGEPAGSGEHVFPASLGGRRTNKNIYCTEHDNGYSSLVATLASQLAVFNSILGVLGDHDKKPRTVVAVDQASGRSIRMGEGIGVIAQHRVLSSKSIAGGTEFEMMFPDQAAVDAFIREQKAQGKDVRVQSKGTPGRFFAGTGHVQAMFGGPCGLAAIAYVAQTFLAQEFPEVARSSALDDFKRFTVTRAKECAKGQKTSAWSGPEPVWWDFEPPVDLTANTFEFGHRVVVGVASDGRCFGRLSFFSSLHFAIDFGMVQTPEAARAVIIDIDPVAEHPPQDIHKQEFDSALGAITRPVSTTEGLRDAISTGSAEQTMHALMQRLTAFEARKAAAKLHAKLAGYAGLPADERRRRFSQVLDVHAQRIWNLTRGVVLHLKDSPQGATMEEALGDLSVLVAHDANAADGLTDRARASLALATEAFIDQMMADQAAGALSEARVHALIAEGEGLALAGRAVLDPFIQTARLR